MIWFLDASALVKRYVREPGSDVVRGLVRRRRRLAAAAVSLVEVLACFASAGTGKRAIRPCGGREHRQETTKDQEPS